MPLPCPLTDDGDMRIDRNEVPMLALRLEIQLDPYGVKLDTERFEQMIKEDNSFDQVCRFCGQLLTEQMEDPADGDSDDESEVTPTPDLHVFCKQLSEQEETDELLPLTLEEKMDMITVDERFSRGSVEVARGGRMTLVSKPSKNTVRRKTIVKEVQDLEEHRRHKHIALPRGVFSSSHRVKAKAQGRRKRSVLKEELHRLGSDLKEDLKDPLHLHSKMGLGEQKAASPDKASPSRRAKLKQGITKSKSRRK